MFFLIHRILTGRAPVLRLTAAAFLIMAGAAGTSPGWRAVRSAPRPAAAAQVTAELLEITPRGFEPGSVTRPAGRFLLALVNRSEFPNMILRLERDDGTLLRTFEMPRSRRRLNVTVTLEPGAYRLVDAERPEAFCSLEITP